MRFCVLLRNIVVVAIAALPATALSERAESKAVSPPVPAAEDTAGIPKRAKLSCAEYRQRTGEQAKRAVFDTRLSVGSWGAIPPGLRKLPPHARLCGADRMGQVVVVSPLFGKELQRHYTPLFEKLGFRPLTCDVSGGQTRCLTKRGRDLGMVLTDANSEALVLVFKPRGGAPSRARGGHG
jgi:hypothetical protein